VGPQAKEREGRPDDRRGAAQVVLYTDLSNPTSNAIYQAIGYRADHAAEECSFHP
jgi:hypothetical protein